MTAQAEGIMRVDVVVPAGDIMDEKRFVELLKDFGFKDVIHLSSNLRIGPLTTQMFRLVMPLTRGRSEELEFIIYDKAIDGNYVYVTELSTIEESQLTERDIKWILYYIQRLLYFGNDEDIFDVLKKLISGIDIKKEQLVWLNS